MAMYLFSVFWVFVEASGRDAFTKIKSGGSRRRLLLLQPAEQVLTLAVGGKLGLFALLPELAECDPPEFILYRPLQ